VDWPRFVALVRDKQRILLTTHIRPDGDAIGSTLAMAAVLERLGKEVHVITGFDLPPSWQFLDRQGRFRRVGNVPREILESIELLLILDTSAWAQLGEMGEVIRSTKAAKAALDHHVSSDELGAELFKTVGADATGRLVIEAADQLGVELTPEIAVPAFVALATDTGWFRFASTTAETYRLAGRLTAAGAVPDQLYRNLYENDSLARLQLIGRAMARVQTELEGRLIYTAIHRADFDAVGALPSDSEDVINLLLAVGGTQVAVIFVEQIGGGYKISFRSRSEVDCSRLAAQFAGGGHKKAAGATVNEPFEAAQANVLDAVRKAMQ
jgi:phosphoesterase RecJ-like protein